jgi:hypothetical protein
VLVGAEEQEFLVHTSFLLTIPFFRGCLPSGMIEAKTNVVRLPEDESRTFRIFTHWLYRGKIPSQVKRNASSSDSMSYTLTLAYSLATKLML